MTHSFSGRRGLSGLAATPVLVFGALVMVGLLLGQLITSAPGNIPLILTVAVAVFFLTVLKPGVALSFLIVAMLLSPEIVLASLPRRDVVIRIEDLLVVVMGLGWLARSAIHKGTDVVPRTPINGWIALYCVCFIVATFQGIVSGDVNPLKAVFYVLKYIEYYIIFFMVAGLGYGRSRYRAYMVVFFLTFMAVNLYAVSQIGHVDRVSAPFEGQTGEPNTLGGYQVLMMCVAMGIFCHIRSLRMAVGMVAVTLFTLWPFLHTLSRASYLALVPACLALVFYNRSSRKWPLVAAFMVAGILAFLILPDNVRDRIMYTFHARPQANIKPVVFLGMQLDPSSSSRWLDWQRAVQYWLERPFFGYGITGRSFLDSQYINNLVETGACGFLSFAVLIASLQYHVWRIYRGAQDDLVRGLALGFLAGNVGILVHAITANSFILVRVMEPYWFLAGMILVSPQFSKQPELPVKKAVRSAAASRNIGMLLHRGRTRPFSGGSDAT
ncbi:MAG: O-antigen ligase family protein [Candidatus Omnitrophota bacterium]